MRTDFLDKLMPCITFLGQWSILWIVIAILCLAFRQKRKLGISLAFNQSRVATRERALVDDFVDRILVCRSRFESPDVDGEIVVNYAPELFGGVRGEDLCGRFIDVKITGADEYDLIAEPIK